MNQSAFVEIEFAALIAFSVVLPIAVYGFMMWKNAISRKTVLLLGLTLIAIAAINVLLLQRLSLLAKVSPSLLDDQLFSSELSLALYLLPAVFAGIGANVISHILISHLREAEERFDRDHERSAEKGDALHSSPRQIEKILPRVLRARASEAPLQAWETVPESIVRCAPGSKLIYWAEP